MEKIRPSGIISISLSMAVPFTALAQEFDNPLGANESLLEIICNVRNALFPILLVLSAVAFIAAAALYLTAGEDQRRQGQAKKALYTALIGSVLVFLSLALPALIANLFDLDPASLPASC